MIHHSGRNLRPIASLLITVAAQVTGFGLVLLISPALPLRSEWFTATIAALIHGATALLVARFLESSFPWQILNLLLPFLLILSPLFGPSMQPIAAVMLLIGVSLYLPTFWTRVPFYPTEGGVYEAVLEELPSERFTFVDLGCGFGTLLFYLAGSRPESRFVGFELSPMALVWSKLRSLRYGNVQIRGRDFWRTSWREFDVVYAFLSPEPMPLLEEKIVREGGKKLVLINSFPLKRGAERVRAGTQTLYIYHFD